MQRAVEFAATIPLLCAIAGMVLSALVIWLVHRAWSVTHLRTKRQAEIARDATLRYPVGARGPSKGQGRKDSP